MANFLAVLIARHRALGPVVRNQGVSGEKAKTLVAYTSEAAHACIARAMEYAGLGSDALRRINADADHRLNLDELRAAIEADLLVGLKPFLVVGTAGTVGIGAIDDLSSLAEIAATYSAWFHVDGAFGALGILSSKIAPRLAGIERADSIALDFHKWGQVPYDAGFILVRDGDTHRDAFATAADYLSRTPRGLSAGDVWPNDLGPDLSRGFRALKTWFTLKTYGTHRLGKMITGTCALADYLAQRVKSENELELIAPVPLNIVCFRYRHATAADLINTEIVMDIHENGIVAPSTVRISGTLAIRAALFNHRTERRHVDMLVDEVLSSGRRRSLEFDMKISAVHANDNGNQQLMVDI